MLGLAETGSSFCAMLVRPTLRRRLEASPLMVWVIEFIELTIAQVPPKADAAKDLLAGHSSCAFFRYLSPNCRFVLPIAAKPLLVKRQSA